MGNFGSTDRLNYTALGDGVNVASRLEGLNEVFGTEILISEETRTRVEGQFETRRIGLVAVRGRERLLFVYELLGRKQAVAAARLLRSRSYEEALALYLGRQWLAAQQVLAGLVKEAPRDRAAVRLLRCCEECLAREPGPEWNGVLTTK